MPQFSLLVRIQDPIKDELDGLLQSLEAQTLPDWELILVLGKTRVGDWDLVSQLISGRPRVRMVLHADDALLAWSCNLLLPELGNWVGFLDQHDRLDPEALAWLAQGITEHPAARVVYADECHRNRFGWQSFITIKGAFDPVRLVSQEYLGALTVVHAGMLETLGGFDRLASDVPTHDLYLRILENAGGEAFCYLPRIACQHYRDYHAPAPKDPRRLPHLVRYDIYAVREHLRRTGQTAELTQLQGTLQVTRKLVVSPGVHVWLQVGDDSEAGTARIHALNRTLQYPPARVLVFHRGHDTSAGRAYQDLAKALGWDYRRTQETLPEALNQALPVLEHDWVALVDGAPINRGWLGRLMVQAQRPGVGAVGARCTDPVRIQAPGVLGYWYAGWDWNTRGRFSRLQVPHLTGALGSGCLLLNARAVRAVDGCRLELPALWAMDLTLRLDQAGYHLIQEPAAHIHTDEGMVPSQAELDRFTTFWAGWKDRFGLHQSL